MSSSFLGGRPTEVVPQVGFLVGDRRPALVCSLMQVLNVAHEGVHHAQRLGSSGSGFQGRLVSQLSMKYVKMSNLLCLLLNQNVDLRIDRFCYSGILEVTVLNPGARERKGNEAELESHIKSYSFCLACNTIDGLL